MNIFSIVIVNFLGLLLIAIIVYWFILSKPKAQQATQQPLDIYVQEGVYRPSMIQAKPGESLQLRFIRKDDTPCSEYVIFEQLNISAKLPLNKPHDLVVTFKKPGDYVFTCQMGMYRGTVLVRG